MCGVVSARGSAEQDGAFQGLSGCTGQLWQQDCRSMHAAQFGCIPSGAVQCSVCRMGACKGGTHCMGCACCGVRLVLVCGALLVSLFCALLGAVHVCAMCSCCCVLSVLLHMAHAAGMYIMCACACPSMQHWYVWRSAVPRLTA
jgi:hypothetical protein